MVNPDLFPALAKQQGAALPRRVLDEVSRSNGGTLSDLFWALDTPGAMVRGTISGLANGDPMRGLRAIGQSDEERVSGRELLGDLGLDPTPGERTWSNFGAGLAAEVLTDPLSYLAGPVKALTPAGKVASKAGLLPNAAESLSRKVLAGQAAPDLAQAAAKTVKKIGRDVSPTDIIGRPLVGRRHALRSGTLGDLIDYAPDPTKAHESVLASLGGNADRLEALRSQKLGKSFGFGLPFMDPVLAVDDPFGLGKAIGTAQDAIGQAYRWGPAGRLANLLTNNDVAGNMAANDQMVAAGTNIARRRAMQAARRDATFQAARLQQAEPDVFTEGGNRSLGRSIEQPVDNKFQPVDDIWQSDHPAARAYMQWWDDKRQQAVKQFTDVGLRGAEFSDPHIKGYLPRRADGALEMAGQRNPTLGKALSTLTSDQMMRAEEMMVPGGRDTIAFELSKDPYVAGAKRGAKNDTEAARYIAEKVFGSATDGNRDQAMTLAVLLNKLPDHLIKDVPLFGQHPVEMITRYLEGRAGAAATQNSLYDSLAYLADSTPSDLVEGWRSISMAEALKRIGARTVLDGNEVVGGSTQIRDRLAKRFGLDPDKIELSSFSVPEDAVHRLTRTRDAFTAPEGAQKFMDAMSAYTAAWKSNILSWPSRIVRDMYSGAYSNWLEGALSKRGIDAAKGLLSRGPEDPAFVRALAKMPLYGGGVDDAVARFWADLDATGLLKTSVSNDRGIIVSGKNVVESLPGAMPDTFTGALSELGPQQGRTWGQYASDIRPRIIPDREVMERNPLVRAGARAGNLSDRINRLSGYIELLTQGVAPEEAARRMMRAHVDYTSLTPYERAFRDTLMPFWAYFSRSAGEVMRQIAERPGGRFGQGLRTYERLQEPQEGQYVPGSVRQNFAVALPQGSFFAPKDPGVTRYLTDIDLPGYDQLNMIRPKDLGQTAREMAKQTNPLLRTMYDLITSTDSFTGRPLKDSRNGSVGKILEAAGGPKMSGPYAAAGEKLVDLIPGVARPLRAVANFVDPNLPIGYGSRALSSAVNNLTGVKFRDFTQDDLDRDAVRRLEEMAAPYTSEMQIPYIPKENKPFVPQGAIDQLDTAAQLRKRLQNGRRARLQQLRA